MAGPFVHRLRVRFSECDRQGVVFNSNYFTYFDVAITELWRAAIGNYDKLVEQGVDLVVAEATARFRSAARFDDEIDIEASIVRMSESSITTRFEIKRNGELLVEGSLRHVCVDAATLAKTPTPEWAHTALSPTSFLADRRSSSVS